MTIRIAYAGPPDKWERMSWSDFISYARDRGIEVFPLDFTRPLPSQLPISLIVHKMTYFMSAPNPSVDALAAFARENPEIPIIDDLSAVAVTLDRAELTRAFEAIEWPSDLRVSLPRTQILNDSRPETIAETVASLRFPILAKAKVAGGTDAAHWMRIVSQADQLVGVRTPTVLQEFVNHGGVVYKVYALGEHIEAGGRPSMRDITEGENVALDFHSQKSDVDNGLWVKKESLGKIELPMDDFRRISAILRKGLRLNLIGFDILIDESKRYWLVDLNFFPGYKNIDNLWETFLNFFLDVIKGHEGRK
jgi:inositol-1,3,4-trisphosphate 5/6-kinase/inositol-tetrakisphosphate 1-kinase